MIGDHIENAKVIAAATETPRGEIAHAVGAHVAGGGMGWPGELCVHPIHCSMGHQ